MLKTLLIALLLACATSTFAAEPIPEFRFRAVEIDKIEIGYGLQMADVDGDGKIDIVLADKNTIQWYENPKWTKHIIAKDLTVRDNVCLAARDIDGDGKCEIAVGGQWNFRETIKDGAVFYLIPPKDRREMWTPVKLQHEPSTHRMHWVKSSGGKFHLMVKPLRGRGSVNGMGNALRVLEYMMPKDPNDRWSSNVVCEIMHLSHNFHPVNWDDDPEEELIIAGKEGVWHFDSSSTSGSGKAWAATQLTKHFAGEIRDGRLPGGRRFIAAIEPMHGTTTAVYAQPEKGKGLWQPLSKLDEALKDGHALACADYLGVGSDQIVVGWRAMNARGIPGIKMFTPLDKEGKRWRETVISSGKVAVEDIKVADLNGDGKIDIVAAARQTKNLVIFFNER